MAQYSENLIPVMTSNTVPSGMVSASSIIDENNPSWKAFDKKKGIPNSWASLPNQSTAWIQYDFPTQKRVNLYSIEVPDPLYAPKNWTFEGYNESSLKWEVVDQRQNEVFVADTKRIFPTNVKTNYQKYRLNITAYSNKTYVIISEIEMFSEIINKILLLSNEKDYSLEYKEGKKENPIMTSNTSPFGEVSASSFSSGYEAWKAFDGNKTNATGAFGWQTNNLSYGWIQYKFNKKTEIYEYVIYCTITNTANTLLRMPKDWTFEGSNDGSSWTVLDTQINQSSWTSNESRKFTFSNYGSFIYYRLNISANNSPTNTYTSVGELELISPTTNKLISIPNHSSNNFIEYGIDSPVQVDSIFSNKNYILSTTESINANGLWTTQINRKPLSIKFN